MTAVIDVDHIDHFQRRVLQDSLTEATAIYWRRRAQTFEDARPQPGDFPGKASELDLRAIDQRMTESRDACLRRAAVAGREEWSAA